MKKYLTFLAILTLITALYFNGTLQRVKTTDPMLIPSISNVCGEESQAWVMPYSLDLPHLQEIPGFENQDTLISFLQQKADDFSWRTFIALNWTADKKGQPNPENCFATGNGRSVWEYWMPANELFVEPGEKPQPWKAGTSIWYGRPKNSGKTSEMRLVGKMPSHMSIANPEDFPVIDDDGKYTLYEIYYNKPAYDYVVESGLYSLEGQREFTKKWPSHTSGLVYLQNGDTVNIEERFQRAYFPVGNFKDSVIEDKPNEASYIFSIGEGAMIIKSAWLTLDERDDFSKYHTREVKLPNGEKHTMGLVAMHVAHKVAEASQWVWSSFQHVNCAPEIDAHGIARLEPGVDYTYFVEAENDPRIYNRKPPMEFQPKVSERMSSQVVAMTKIQPDTEKMNSEYHKMIAAADPQSVWLNYKLVGTQWPFDPVLFTDGRPYKPEKMANSLMETYHQETSDCMGCHRKARFGEIEGRTGFQYNADFIYGLSSAQ